jgi:choice-of-anchor A domain-containing protein
MKKNHPQNKNRGSALLLSLLALVVLLTVGMGLLALGLTFRIHAVQNASNISARCAADAGLTEALYKMNKKLQVKPWNGSNLPQTNEQHLPNCDALYSYEVTGDIIGGYKIESTGICGGYPQTVACTLQLQGPFEAAIFTKEQLELKNSAVVDWYNYTPDDENMKIGTNSIIAGTIVLKNSSLVNGDIVVGLGGNPDAVINNYGATITGKIHALTEKYPMTSISVPDWLLSLPTGGTIKNDTTISASAKYYSIELKNNKTLKIENDIALYIVDEIILNNSAEIVIDNDASLILYLGGDFEGKNSSDINNKNKNAKKLQIYSLDSCESMIFKNSSDFYGTIYAPNANVVMDNCAEINGSVIAKSFEQKNSGTFNYDASLRDATVNDEAVRFVITDWHQE